MYLWNVNFFFQHLKELIKQRTKTQITYLTDWNCFQSWDIFVVLLKFEIALIGNHTCSKIWGFKEIKHILFKPKYKLAFVFPPCG